jgi:hypothetical protein
MQTKWSLAALAVATLIVTQANVVGHDLGAQIAKHALGRLAREGIEEAVEDAVKDATFDAALNAVVPEVLPERELSNDVLSEQELSEDYELVNEANREAIGSVARSGVEAAMVVANVASSIDSALDVADAAKAIHRAAKVGKAIKAIKR